MAGAWSTFRPGLEANLLVSGMSCDPQEVRVGDDTKSETLHPAGRRRVQLSNHVST